MLTVGHHRTGAIADIASTRSSSAFNTAVPEVGSDATSSALALATPSIPPRRAVCACPTRVTTPIVGEATSHKCVISPNPRIPISTTTVRAAGGVDEREGNSLFIIETLWACPYRSGTQSSSDEILR